MAIENINFSILQSQWETFERKHKKKNNKYTNISELQLKCNKSNYSSIPIRIVQIEHMTPAAMQCISMTLSLNCNDFRHINTYNRKS